MLEFEFSLDLGNLAYFVSHICLELEIVKRTTKSFLNSLPDLGIAIFDWLSLCVALSLWRGSLSIFADRLSKFDFVHSVLMVNDLFSKAFRKVTVGVVLVDHV